MIENVLKQAERGEDLSMEVMSSAIDAIMQGQWDEESIERLLVALHRKGETVAEIAGAAAAMRRQMTPIRTRHTVFLDVVGTGGDGSGTFNISTAAALVTAAAGVPVAKHGNRRFTSRSGSADVLAALGVNIEAAVPRVEKCLDELGLCFCFAPLLHQAMRHVGPVRRRISHPTVFNLLGPLSNPAGAPYQLLGVGRPVLRPMLAEALALLGTQRSLVVHGEDGLDEVTLGARTFALEMTPDETRDWTFSPADFGLTEVPLNDLCVDGPEESAAMIRGILEGHRGPARDIVVANGAAALWTVRYRDTLLECAAAAAEAIDSGAARDLLANLVVETNR